MSFTVLYDLVVSDNHQLMDGISVVGGRLINDNITNKGTLQDELPFYIYRVLLYDDGFNQKKSLGDIRPLVAAYMLAVGFNQFYRSLWAANSVINLSGDFQSANGLMNTVRVDIANSVAD